MADVSQILIQLEKGRQDLLDLSSRNRLLDTPRDDSKSVEIVEETADDIFRLLVAEGKTLTFEPDEAAAAIAAPTRKKAADDEAEAPAADETEGKTKAKPRKAASTKRRTAKKAAEDEEAPTEGAKAKIDSIGIAERDSGQKGTTLEERHADLFLQTSLAPSDLDERLLGMYYDAQTHFQDRGINILYLAIGLLKWVDPEDPDKAHHAPLILVPVQLERQTALGRYKLRYADDDINTNLTLKQRMKNAGIELPELPETDDIVPSNYFKQVQAAIGGMKGWEVRGDDQVLWFFSFSRLLMYRDLDPATWPADRPLAEHVLIRSLLGQGFPAEQPLCDDDARIDEFLDVADITHVVDADSSQSLVVEEARRGRNLVIQGPPGTGKSQTITNLIAAAVKSGKTVLFVAEKMAALEVVKKRLDNIGLGDMCLELHSEKASKRVVLEELDRTLQLGKPKTPADLETQVRRLREVRATLNKHADAMHDRIEPSGQTPFQVMGELIRLRADGVPAPNFVLMGSQQWNPETLRRRKEDARNMTEALQEIGNPSQYAWRGAQLDSIVPTDLMRLTADTKTTVEQLYAVTKSAEELARAIGREPAPKSLQDADQLLKIARTLAAVPELDRGAVANAVWKDQREDLTDLVKDGAKLALARQKLTGVVADVAWTTDVSEARRDLGAYGRSWFRIFRSKYRHAKTVLAGLLTGPPPGPLEVRLAILDGLLAAQQTKQTIEKEDAVGKQAFGALWRGEKSDFTRLNAIDQWDRDAATAYGGPGFRAVIAKTGDFAPLKSLTNTLEQQLKDLRGGLTKIMDAVLLEPFTAFGVGTPPPALPAVTLASEQNKPKLPAPVIDRVGTCATVPLATLAERLSAWVDSPEGITKWMRYRVSRDGMKLAGLTELCDRIDGGQISPPQVPTQFDFAYYENLLRDFGKKHTELAKFDAAKFNRLIDEFRELDLKHIETAKMEVAAAHFNAIPRGAFMVGEVGVVRSELQKKRRQMPLRTLFKKAGQAIKAIKPVFMMSPLSVAEFLEPGAIDFDLLLIDEASQIRPIDALGAVARCKQMVVVGDDKQMPPTQFFNSVLSDSASSYNDEEPDSMPADLESILGLCIARNVPQRMLRWHYRSKHHSLIAVSNKEFYDNRLYVIPSPQQGGELGLKWHFIENGRFERGKSRANPIEAEIVADAVMAHARTHANWSLGVGTFSVSQRDAVIKAVEKRRQAEPKLEAFFNTEVAEPFFVKNLENIQGDERDVIYVSVGYGPDADGKISLNFGPVSASGGERRLNVLMTRAKRRCEMFSSIHAEDIDLGRATGRGPAVFRKFLEVAAHGGLAEKAVSQSDGNARFTSLIQKLLQDKGLKADLNVGVAGLFVDLAVADPADPDRYLLGVEIDGPGYHDARSARDRDRLREQVLIAQGWQVVRIWCAEWMQRPEEQMQRIMDAFAKAKAGPPAPAKTAKKETATPVAALTSPTQPVVIAREAAPEAGEVPKAKPYEVADFKIAEKRSVEDLKPTELLVHLVAIIEAEGPVHADVIAERFCGLYPKKITDRKLVTDRLGLTLSRKQAESEGDFYSIPNRPAVPRDRTDAPPEVRKTENLPPSEVRAALLQMITVSLGAAQEEAIVECVKTFGLRNAQPLRDAIATQFKTLVDSGQIVEKDGVFRVRV